MICFENMFGKAGSQSIFLYVRVFTASMIIGSDLLNIRVCTVLFNVHNMCYTSTVHVYSTCTSRVQYSSTHTTYSTHCAGSEPASAQRQVIPERAHKSLLISERARLIIIGF